MAYRKTDRVREQLEDKRLRILSATRHLVMEGGSLDAPIVEVARRASVATGTVYRYFPSKTDLLTEVVRLASQHELDVIAGIAQSDARARDRLDTAVSTFVDRALRGARLARLLIVEPIDVGISGARRHYRRALALVIARIVADGVETGEFAQQNPAAAAAAIVGALMESLNDALATESAVTEEPSVDLVDEMRAFCLRAVDASKTH
ncbi:MAG TPA: TetR/AcrR family transcriptional regulator [Aliidongia sp.]|uniref:TetR/AcrR family transcriptional regulator n=1 Tax=Aliidongia sp. TaxID=1914230 RepID=UPI002DDD1833|nr:TetR/AcrR family transcriptional regulator [Aliidongia sp.]HEV2675653.1 TetR/AcrR family transcriptional regulator [Aliidongia sp.]